MPFSDYNKTNFPRNPFMPHRKIRCLQEQYNSSSSIAQPKISWLENARQNETPATPLI